MIQTIHIGHLLRETVTSPYRNLVTRPTGAAIRNRIQETMAGSDCLTALLDFSGIERPAVRPGGRTSLRGGTPRRGPPDELERRRRVPERIALPSDSNQEDSVADQ